MCYRNRLREVPGLFRNKGRYLFFIVISAVLCAGPSLAIDISDRPLDVEFHAASTTVMFVLDDSGSMDWEFMTSESGGKFSGNYYLYPSDPGDNAYGSGNMSATEMSMWKSQWYGYNKLYYNPGTVYTPWPSNTDSGNLPDADTQNPRSNPIYASDTLALNNTYLSMQEKGAEGVSYDPVIMDQRGPNDSENETNCGRWVFVGEYELDHTETWQVIIKRTGTGISGSSTVSGAVKFKNMSDPSEVIIIDDEDGEPEYKEYGNWNNSSRYPNYSNITRYTGDAGAMAVYTPILTSSGLYEISVWWNCYDARDREAEVTVAQQILSTDIVEIKNSHYYLVDDLSGEVYLVNIDGSSRSYYRVEDDDGDLKVEDGELVEIDRVAIPESIRPQVGDASGIAAADAADLQNFANWYSFYRRRSLTAKAAVSRTIVGVDGLKIGFYSINKNLKQAALSVKITQANGTVVDDTLELLTRLYELDGTTSGTPLREGLATVGEYYKGTTAGSGIGTSPYQTADNGGECQRVYAIAMTDGYWTSSSLSIGDEDLDGVSNTLADVAMKYYKNDLRTDLDNNVPPSICNTQSHQHMVTFSVSFGVFGTLNPDEYDICTLKNASGQTPDWPNPFDSSTAKIDDLWHAAANTKGAFFSASDPESLVKSLTDIFIEIEAREISGAAVAVSAEKIYTESTMYEGSYLSTNWTGDIKAYSLTYDDTSKTIEIDQTPAWSGADKLNDASVTWDSRKIITNDGATGKAFRWSSLSTAQKSYLDNNEYMLKYLRGFRPSDTNVDVEKLALQQFRGRESRLGDIVNSSPVKIGDSLYVGANDGMLHVFNVADGKERFAYVPDLVFENLKALTESGYQHKFYVDQTPVYSEIGFGDSMKKYLVGGLRKGGKGYYCLNVTDVDTMVMTEENLVALFKWEFKDIPDLGYSFSQPVIIQTKSADYEYIVVFGNGYNSVNGHAVLFIVDLFTGDLIKKIDTLADGDNGLSTPIVTDVNNDMRVDYVYAGDLKGNLWKFDLSSENYGEWDVAFKDKTTGNPAPLFKTAADQPITSRPEVMTHCSGRGYMVAFGTGKYLGVSDLSNTSTQAVYGIWDYGDDDDDGEFLGNFHKTDLSVSMHPDTVTLLEQGVLTTAALGDSIVRTTTEKEADWRVVEDLIDTNANQTQVDGQMPNPIKNIGWFLDLETIKERVYQDVFNRNGSLTVLSLIPVADACSGGGYSMVYTLNPCTGGQVEEAWTYKKEKLEGPTIIETQDGPKMLFSHDKDTPPLPGIAPKMGRYFWREIY